MLIYEALRNDHDTVKNLLDELVELDTGDANERKQLIQQIRDELIPHARAEESVFYNSLRSLEAGRDVIKHAYKEHMEAEGLLRILQVKDKIDMEWKKTARKLQRAILHHINEEEGEIFSIAQRLFTDEEAEMMARSFEELKPKIKEEGLTKTTGELIANLMPPRFSKIFHTKNNESFTDR